MSTINGVVKAKSKKGNSICINDEWYSTRAASDLDHINKGDSVTFNFKQNGQWKNIDGKVTKAESTLSSGNTPASTNKYPAPPIHTQLAIIRQNALTNAVNFSQGSDRTPEQILEVAQIFESYTSGNIDLQAFASEKSAPVPPTQQQQSSTDFQDDDVPF